MFLGALLAAAQRTLLPSARGAAALMVFVLAFAFLQLGDGPALDKLDPIMISNGALTASLNSFHGNLPKHARVLFLHDPFPADSYNPLWATQLCFRDRDITVDREVAGQRSASPYDLIVDYVDGRFELPARNAP
jgi:hypothetical protein